VSAPLDAETDPKYNCDIYSPAPFLLLHSPQTPKKGLFEMAIGLSFCIVFQYPALPVTPYGKKYHFFYLDLFP